MFLVLYRLLCFTSGLLCCVLSGLFLGWSVSFPPGDLLVWGTSVVRGSSDRSLVFWHVCAGGGGGG